MFTQICLKAFLAKVYGLFISFNLLLFCFVGFNLSPLTPPLGTFMLYIINNFRSLHVFASHLQIIALRVYTSYFASDGESDIDDRRNQKLITLDGAIN